MHPLQIFAKKLFQVAQALAWREYTVVTLGETQKARKILPDPGKPRYDTLIFTNRAIEKIKAWNLSEADVADVFFHGEVIKDHLMSRKYNGYEIGLAYGQDRITGQYIIYSAWKRERR